MVEVTGNGEVVDRGGVTSVDGSGNQAPTIKPVDGSVGTDTATPSGRQDWWPEGVNSEDELKAYVEGLGKQEQTTEQVVDPNAPKEKTTEDETQQDTRTDEDIKASLQAAGGLYADPKYEPFAIEVERTGALKPESITAAAAAFGVSEEAVKSFVDGQMAQRELAKTRSEQTATAAQQAMATAIVKVVPDNAAYEAIVGTWGKANISPAEAKAYDSALDRGDADTVTALLTSFKARYDADGNGTPRRDITQGQQRTTQDPQGQAPAIEPFTSQAEWVKVSGSAQYRNDPKFRAAQDARYGVSVFSR